MSDEAPLTGDPRRIVSDLERERSRLRILNDFAIELLALPTESDLVWYLAREVVGRLGFVDCVVYLVDEGRRLIRQVAAIGEKNPLKTEIVNALEIPIGQGITGSVVRAGEPIIVDDLLDDDRYIADIEPARSEICVPLIIDGQPVGAIDCEHPEPGHFGPDHLELLSTVAAMASAKLKLINQTRQEAQRTSELHGLNRQLRDEIQQRKGIEVRLRESEERFRSVIDNSPNAIFLKDLEGRFVLVNKCFSNWYGVSEQRVLGRKSYDIFPSAYAEMYTAMDRQILDGGAIRERELLVPFADGTDHLALVTKFPVFRPDGSLAGVGTTNIDITERQIAQDALREKQWQLQSILDHAPAMIFLKDRLGRYLMANREFERLFGVASDEMVGKLPAEVLPANDDGLAESSRAQDLELLRTKQAMAKEESFHRDGILRTFQTMKFPILDAGGNLTGIGAVSSDITERKLAEERLRESEERLRQATKLAKIGYYLWDAVADRCLFCSEEHARIHGLSPEQYIARASVLEGDFSLTHPDDREAVRAAMKALRKGEAIEIEYRTIAPDGEIRYVREVAKPVFGADGSVVQEIGSSQDVTEMRQAEERLRQAQKMEAVGQLTGGVAHDFNNLLAVIQGNAELLADAAGDTAELRDEILRAAACGAALTQRLLAFSRQQPLRPRSLDLAAVVSGMTALLKRTLGETIEVVTGAGHDHRNALADPGQLENALLNLAINARDAMPRGGKLTIECANVRLDEAYLARNPEAVSGDYVVTAVSDNGTGMPAAVLEHVFEPFFTTKGPGEGSGLGLSMVYGFAKQSGGHVSIYSEEGLGTTVKIYLPRSVAVAERKAADHGDSLPRGRGELVLIIEDDEDVRALAVRLLGSLNYRTLDVPETASAQAVLDRGEKIDLVLSDVVLPGGISGPQFAAALKAERPSLKVIFMSGYPALDAARNSSLGPDQVLLDKPFRRNQLARALRAALD